MNQSSFDLSCSSFLEANSYSNLPPLRLVNVNMSLNLLGIADVMNERNGHKVGGEHEAGMFTVDS